MQNLLTDVKKIALKAGDAIMEVYGSEDFGTETKEEFGFTSPLTKADKTANDIIVTELGKISQNPIVSEENEIRSAKTNKFWLVDPLDGTKEFVSKNGQFTVNIALIEDGEPILGVVYAPAKKLLYWGAKNEGAFKQEDDGPAEEIHAIYKDNTPTVIASRSHRGEELEKFIQSIGEHKEISMGSSLKLCLVAEGTASVYPRFTPTHLWDTAAADAVVRVAGGTVEDFDGNLLRYELEGDLKNPYFIVRAGNQKNG